MKVKSFKLKAMAVLLLVMFISGVVIAGDKMLVNGFDADYPPFSFIDKSGKPAGIDVDSLNWIAKKMGFKVKHQPTDWSAIVPSLQTGKIDLIASGMSITAERQKVVAFTNPYWTVRQVLVTHKNSNLTVEKCLQTGRKIGTQRGNAETKWIKANLIEKGKKFELLQYDSAPLAIGDMVMGRIDSVATSDTILKEAVERGLPIKSIGSYGQPDTNYGYAVRKDDKKFLNKLNKGLDLLHASPYWPELKKKYGFY